MLLLACFCWQSGLLLSGCGAASPAAAISGNLVIASNPTNFGTVPIGQTAKATISVTNAGGAAVQISQIAVTGQSFAVTSQPAVPVTIAPNDSYGVAVQFDPKAAGPQAGTLVLASDAAGGSTNTVSLSGTGETSTTSPGLTLSTSDVSFGDVTLNTPATQSVTLTSSGLPPLTISAGAIAGSGFSMSGITFPITLDTGGTATLNVQFDPAAAGTASGTVTLTSNASSGGTATILLSGTGESSVYTVELRWTPPASSSDPAEGYEIYRSGGGSTSFQLLNAVLDLSTSYADSAVTSGDTYDYYVVTVGSSGLTSAPSNVFAVTIP